MLGLTRQEIRLFERDRDALDEIDVDAERFFRAVGRAILERSSKPSRLPLLLASLRELAAVYRY